MNLRDLWSPLRDLIRNHHSFSQIKDLVGSSGLPIHKLAHMTSTLGGPSKGQLMDAIDDLFNALSPEEQDRAVLGCVSSILKEERADLTDQLEDVLSRFGWGVSNKDIFPLQLQLDIDTTKLPAKAQEGLNKCLRRYRDGDFSGAMTAVCGTVDILTEQLYAKHNLGNHRDASYQERISVSYNTLEREVKESLLQSGISSTDVERMWQNYKGAINQAGYLLGAFRRMYSDVHGHTIAPREAVQHAINCAVFVLRSLTVFEIE